MYSYEFNHTMYIRKIKNRLSYKCVNINTLAQNKLISFAYVNVSLLK